jgi:predicted aspartyl protease
MNGDEATTRGRVTVEFTVANNHDVLQAESGALAPGDIRQVQIRGVVDRGATRLVLPESVVARLGLPDAGETKVRYADQRSTTRRMVKNVWVKLLGRQGVYRAMVEPDRTDALIGVIVLEDLDFLVDCSKQALYPRDPDMIVSEVE